MVCPVMPEHGDYATKAELGAHIANVHPELTQNTIQPMPTSDEQSVVKEIDGVTKVTENLDAIKKADLQPKVGEVIRYEGKNPPIIVDKKPLELRYQYTGKCSSCGSEVKTLVLNTGKGEKKETHAIAYCPTEDKQVEDRQVEDLTVKK
jgi:hypothetical protein